MRREKFVPFVLAYMFLLGVLTGCSLDRWAEVEAGEYVQTSRQGISNQVGRGVIQRMEVDRHNRQVTFFFEDGSEIDTSFVSKERADWPAGCPTNINMTHMEVLELEVDTLTIGSLSFETPILVRDCPRDPERVVLRSDGEMGGSGTACAYNQECIYFVRPSAQ
jgi:hypothetical protein